MRVSKIVVAAGAAGILAFSAMAPAGAQATPPRPNPARAQLLRHPLLGHLAVILGRLNLTPAQKEQVKGFLQSAQTKVKAIRRDTSLTPAQRRTQVQPVVKDLRQSILSILTPEQKTKLKRLNAAAPGSQIVPARWLAVVRKLDLAPAQKQQVKGFLADARAKAKIVRESSLSPAEKRAKLQEIAKTARTNALGILTPEQKAKLRKMAARKQ